MPYYAVAKGRTIGIFRAWYKAEKQVNRFSGNEHKKFDTINEAREYLRRCGLFVPEVKRGRPRKGRPTLMLEKDKSKSPYMTQSLATLEPDPRGSSSLRSAAFLGPRNPW
ncbi:hypothetical protein GSI_03572 [Ganoderma sinense ZZ0214-1]|uniref:Ribonuclease H n=1 Tax=Ganoderma sinense ZZ0214-1 TaxID=1077348 RepID=A0A2G8SJB4_9APHY|nr:hypothetical protein GSI_03572 [Ganoderma sinense ZZ0214-1]